MKMTNSARIGLCFFLLLVLLPLSYGFAGQKIKIDADDQFDYAEASFAGGLYLQAAAEYRRFVHFFPHDLRIPEAMYQTGRALFRAQSCRKAIAEFNTLIGRFKENPYVVRSHFMISDCHLQMGDAGQALLDLQNLIRISSDAAAIDEAHYRLGWIYLETRRWEKAKTAFANVSPAGRERFALELLSAELAEEAHLPRKDPALSGFLSIVPGGGFAYCGEYRNALISFLVNGLLIFATAESFSDDNVALGSLLGVVTFGFYAGNIYGGVNSAQKYNRHVENKFINRLRQNLKVKLLSRREVNRIPAIVLSLQFSF